MNKIICDEWSYIENLENESINLISIDPPYGIKYQDLDWDKKVLNWRKILTEFYRLLKSNGNLIVFQGWSNVLNLLNLSKD